MAAPKANEAFIQHYPGIRKSGHGAVSQFIDRNFLHFNARELRDAAHAYRDLIDRGGKMFVTLAGAMSTGELGISLAEMIRKDKIHAICCTGANLEEDIFNLVAHSKYVMLPHYRDLTPEDEETLERKGLPRVTDTAIPEEAAMNLISRKVRDYWEEFDRAEKRAFPHEFLYRLIREGNLKHEIDPDDSWVIAAEKKNLPIFVPGWEDSTLGNMFAALNISGKIKNPNLVKDGIEYMIELADWYKRESKGEGIGFLQLAGGIAGDFPICVVPMLRQDLKEKDTPFWAYFCQVTDALEASGGYSGASPREKITWSKIGVSTPAFAIQGDASLCAPLIFAYVLGW